MSEENNKINLDDLVGQVIDGSVLESLVTNGRVQFDFKDVINPSAVSSSDYKDNIDGQSEKDNTDEYDLNAMVNSVKENEDLVKTLEDMRDDMLKDMKIAPATNKIADAAKALGSKDGTITKDVFDKAETIMDEDYQAITNWGFDPKIAAITGNGKVLTDDLGSCDQVTKAIFDDFKIDKKSDFDKIQDKPINEQIAEAEEDFAEKMRKMFIYLINELFWNFIWARMWTSIFDLTEKVIAKPIDTIVLIMRSIWAKPPWYKLSEENYYIYGPVHRILNALKILFLCRIPNGAWSDYKPEDKIKIYVYKRGMVQLVALCSDIISGDEVNDPCADQYDVIEPYDSDDDSNDSINRDDDDAAKQAFDKTETKLSKVLPLPGENEPVCPKTNLNKSFEDIEKGTNPNCSDAAKTVLEAAYKHALYNNNTETGEE